VVKLGMIAELLVLSYGWANQTLWTQNSRPCANKFHDAGSSLSSRYSRQEIPYYEPQVISPSTQKPTTGSDSETA